MSDPSDTPRPLPPLTERLGRHGVTLGVIAGAPLLAVALGAVGLDDGVSAVLGPVSVAQVLLSGGLLAAVYWAAGAGLAWPLARWLAPDSPDRPWIQAGLGVCLMPWLSHLLGVLGAFAGTTGQIFAIAVVAFGAALLLAQASRAFGARATVPPAAGGWLAAVLPIAVALTAACNPPGMLYRSEAGGFDAMSYHLPLAQEWARQGRIWPLEHNVYSYLPSHLEASFTHLSVMLGGGAAPLGRSAGLLAHDGVGLTACQLLHVLAGVVGAVLLGRAVRRAATLGGLSGRAAAAAGALAGATLLALPWLTVCASLAYNEAAVCAALAAAMLAAEQPSTPPWKRAVLSGLFVGAAIGFKPSSAFMVAPMAGLLLMSRVPMRAWAGVVIAGTLATGAMVAPWAVRNAAACGNPIFPAGADALGRGAWSAEQAARFKAGHSGAGSWSDHAALLVSPAGDPSSVDNQPRGVLHRQWGLMWPAALALAGASVATAAGRRWALAGVASLIVAAVWWIGWSHAQSRFLVPVAPVLAGLVGMGAAAALAGASAPGALGLGGARRLLYVLAACVPLVQSAIGLATWLEQAGWRPNRSLVYGAAAFSGEGLRADFLRATPTEQRAIEQQLSPTAFCNLAIPPNETVYLLGDAAVIYFTGRIVYHTTWDASPLGRAIAASGGTGSAPEAWTQWLRRREGGGPGADWVLINERELRRYWQSGWYDPLVTQENVLRWMRSLGRPDRAWPNADGSATVLFRLRPARSGGTT